MPTNNKTSLGLNKWTGTDKPKRSDFVQDNTTINTLLTTHFGDKEKHLSAADRTLLTQSFILGDYSGNGESTQKILLPFEPRIVIIFIDDSPMNYYDPRKSYNSNNFAIITENGESLGARLNGNELTVCQTLRTPTGGGILVNLNCDYEEYAYIAFR